MAPKSVPNPGNRQVFERRSFLQLGGAAALGMSLPQFLQQTQVYANGGLAAKETNCIFIWTRGGTSHHDTLDPKPTASDGVRGPFRVVSTSVPGVHFSEICPRLAKELNRFSVMRSWNPKNAGHGVADQWCMSGRNPNPSLTIPVSVRSSVIKKVLSQRYLPSFNWGTKSIALSKEGLLGC